MSTDALRSFLADLAQNPQRAVELKQDPDGVMQRAGLSSEDQATLRSGDPAAIHALVSQNLGDDPGGTSPPPTIVVVLVMFTESS